MKIVPLSSLSSRSYAKRFTVKAQAADESAQWIGGCCAVLGYEGLVRRHVGSTLGNDRPYVVECALSLFEGQRVGPRVVAVGTHILTDEQEKPALHVEQLVLIAHDAAVAAEQIEALLQAVGQRHVATVAPET